MEGKEKIKWNIVNQYGYCRVLTVKNIGKRQLKASPSPT
jgi:hypothetical protein